MGWGGGGGPGERLCAGGGRAGGAGGRLRRWTRRRGGRRGERVNSEFARPATSLVCVVRRCRGDTHGNPRCIPFAAARAVSDCVGDAGRLVRTEDSPACVACASA